MSYIFVKTVINNLCRPVKILENEELSISQFVERALQVHELDASEIQSVDFTLKDTDNMEITDMAMINQWKSDSNFKIKIDLKVSRNKFDIVQESLRNYLVEQKMDHLFDEHEIQKFLSPYSRRKLIKSLVSFIADEYNGKASQADIKMVCHATIAVFGCLKTDRSAIGGIDMLYDCARKTGYLYHSLNYESKKKRKSARALEQLSDDEDSFQDEDKETILNFFKRCVLPKDRKEVENKMKETKAFRRHMILNDFEKYQDSWQFYFVLPELILFDFKLLFENANECGLIASWQEIKNVPYTRFGIRIEKSEYPITRKNEDIFKLFMFAKLLPTPRQSFTKAMKNLLMYIENPNADVMNVRDKNMKNPYIIGIFSITTNSVAYFIDLQDGVLPMPSEFDFIQVFDLFIKMHHVFNFEYAKEFSKMIYFFEYVLYGIEASKRFLTPKMLDVAMAVCEAKKLD